tara:strand:+ start:171 stop:431 length:261 start_codon:yes stop_codon:yes gene_type:complete
MFVNIKNILNKKNIFNIQYLNYSVKKKYVNNSLKIKKNEGRILYYPKYGDLNDIIKSPKQKLGKDLYYPKYGNSLYEPINYKLNIK